jgi:hypothetical protein
VVGRLVRLLDEVEEVNREIERIEAKKQALLRVRPLPSSRGIAETE